MSNWINTSISSLFNEAVQCNYCFGQHLANEVHGNIPQPRWIGPLYMESMPRVLVLLLNPGSGKGYKQYQNIQYNPLDDYKAGRKDIVDYFLYQRKDMNNWGHGKFVKYYENWLSLNFDKIAFTNIAWCATEKNDYPSKMLNACFKRFTKRLLELLAPNVVLFSGVKTWRYEQAIKEIDRNISVIKIWHYANRKSEEENKEHISQAKRRLRDSA